MTPRSLRARRTWRVVAVLSSALVLAGCTNSTSTVAHVTGIPSLGIAVPLHKVACTTSNSCIALGTTGSQLAPSSVGEYRQSNGSWSVLNIPEAPSSLITSTSCWKTGCLIGGIQPSGSLVWAYNASSQSVTVQDVPPTSQGVRALDCFVAGACAALVNTTSTASSTGTTNNLSAISFTSDGGVTWSAPTPLPWTLGETVKSVSCTDALNCMVSAESGAGTLDLEVTHDAGLNWIARPTPPSWVSLSSLHCVKLTCVAIANTTTSSFIVRSTTFARLWHATALGVKASALACTSIGHCVIVGENATGQPWLATLTNSSVVASRLQYVPSALVDVACGTTTCVAIGVSTLLALHP